mmetsp:Transcript_4905/g.10341  ORF Transcript_4905/g.10341 Transcript_4905/m.10341 type:complete len:430 (-) Transcript_4905:146-1435(-)
MSQAYVVPDLVYERRRGTAPATVVIGSIAVYRSVGQPAISSIHSSSGKTVYHKIEQAPEVTHSKQCLRCIYGLGFNDFFFYSNDVDVNGNIYDALCVGNGWHVRDALSRLVLFDGELVVGTLRVLGLEAIGIGENIVVELRRLGRRGILCDDANDHGVELALVGDELSATVGGRTIVALADRHVSCRNFRRGKPNLFLARERDFIIADDSIVQREVRSTALGKPSHQVRVNVCAIRCSAFHDDVLAARAPHSIVIFSAQLAFPVVVALLFVDFDVNLPHLAKCWISDVVFVIKFASHNRLLFLTKDAFAVRVNLAADVVEEGRIERFLFLVGVRQGTRPSVLEALDLRLLVRHCITDRWREQSQQQDSCHCRCRTGLLVRSRATAIIATPVGTSHCCKGGKERIDGFRGTSFERCVNIQTQNLFVCSAS